MTLLSFPLRALGLVAVLALLAGCSGLRLIDSDVTSFARWQVATAGVAGAPGTTYRFERLPSQDRLSTPRGELSQDELEAAAAQVLERRGLVLKPDAPVLIVQVGMVSVTQPPSHGSVWPGGGVAVGTGSAGSFVGLSLPIMRYDPPLQLREVSVVMRDSRSNAVVYETRARHSGLGGDARTVWPAMLEAALNGFPNPPQGARRVNVEVPR